MSVKPFSTTGIGSLPHRNAEDACRLILETFDIPFWPQLPNLSYKEGMVAQYSEGMPFFRTDDAKGSVHIDRRGTDSDELDRFYEGCGDTARIAVSEEYARGLHMFFRMIKGRNFPILKGHITGPLTYTLGLCDQTGRAVYYDEELREISLLLLKAKIRWQIDLLKVHAEEVIIFIDEPILSALGTSTYMGVSREEAVRMMSELCSAIKAEGAKAGIHCCGRADWPILIDSGADIMSFDAFDYASTLVIFPAEVKAFLEKGGILAWGIIPTTEAVNEETPESIKKRFDERMVELSKHLPSGLLKNNILLTPSCGTGSRSIEETHKIFQLLLRLKEELV